MDTERFDEILGTKPSTYCQCVRGDFRTKRKNPPSLSYIPIYSDERDDFERLGSRGLNWILHSRQQLGKQLMAEFYQNLNVSPDQIFKENMRSLKQQIANLENPSAEYRRELQKAAMQKLGDLMRREETYDKYVEKKLASLRDKIQKLESEHHARRQSDPDLLRFVGYNTLVEARHEILKDFQPRKPWTPETLSGEIAGYVVEINLDFFFPEDFELTSLGRKGIIGEIPQEALGAVTEIYLPES